MHCILAAILLAFPLVFGGCASPALKQAGPGYASLGREYPTFTPPLQPPPDGAASAITDNLTGDVTLEQALGQGLLHNPDLRAFSWEMRAAEARELQAGLPPNPELSTEMENFGGEDDLKGFRGAETTVQLSQLIETGGKRAKRRQVARSEKDLAGWEYEGKRLDVYAEVSAAYWETYAAQERFTIAQELAGLAGRLHDAVVEKVRAGKVPGLEEIQAQVPLTTARIELEQSRRELAAARKKLAASWGAIEPRFVKAAPKTDGLLPAPEQRLLTGLIQQNPDIARWTAELEKNRAAIALSDAGAMPDVTVSAGPRYYNETDNKAFVMGITVPLPVFNRNQGERAEARYKLARAEEDRRASILKTQALVAQACQDLSSAYHATVSLRDTALPAAESAFGATLEGYREGKCGYLQVLEAERTLFETKRQYITAFSGYHKARTALERLIGQRLPAQNIDAKEEI